MFVDLASDLNVLACLLGGHVMVCREDIDPQRESPPVEVDASEVFSGLPDGPLKLLLCVCGLHLDSPFCRILTWHSGKQSSSMCRVSSASSWLRSLLVRMN